MTRRVDGYVAKNGLERVDSSKGDAEGAEWFASKAPEMVDRHRREY
jgi:hypothetical protein